MQTPAGPGYGKSIIGPASPNFPRLARVWSQIASYEVFHEPIAKQAGQFKNFVKEAHRLAIPYCDAYVFWSIKSYEEQQRNWINVSEDQLPGMVCLSSSSRLKINRIFGNGSIGERVDSVLKGGFYGTGSQILDTKHLEELKDYAVLAYMLEHLAHAQEHGHFDLREQLSPIIPCIGDIIYWDHVKSDGRVTFDSIAQLQIDRINDLVQKIHVAGHRVRVDETTGMSMWNFKGLDFWLIPMVLDIKKREIYVVWKRENKMEKEELASFVQKNRHIRTNAVLNEHLENLALFKGNKSESILMLGRESVKGIWCADSRRWHHELGNTDLIGGIGTREEYERLLGSNSIYYILDRLHTQCGYITTAARIDLLFHQIKEMQNGDKRLVVESIWNKVHLVRRAGKANPFPDAQKIAVDLGLGEDNTKMFMTLFGGESTGQVDTITSLQRVLRHMMAKTIISGYPFNGYKMGAARYVHSLLHENGFCLESEGEQPGKNMNPIDWNKYLYLVTEQVGLEAAFRVADIFEQNGNPNHKRVDFAIANMLTGGWYSLPEYLPNAVKEGISGGRLAIERDMLLGIDPDGQLQFERRPVLL